jgi:2Fe-2S ferredoxin
VKIIATDRKGAEHTLEGRDGWSVMEILRDGGLDIAAECGGACACATCHVFVDQQWLGKLPKKDDMEVTMLDFAPEVEANSRLSCQIKVTPELEGLVVRMPKSQH